jgi:dipeptidyl aminopeptidase/acylaminoacyl peptidase
MRALRLVALIIFSSLIPVTGLAAQAKRPITFDDFIGLPVVSDPKLSPDGKWVAYTVTTPSLKDNRGFARIWLVDVATGRSRQLTQGPGSDFSPRWSPDGQTLAFISTRQGGPQIWVLAMAGGGGDAR